MVVSLHATSFSADSEVMMTIHAWSECWVSFDRVVLIRVLEDGAIAAGLDTITCIGYR